MIYEYRYYNIKEGMIADCHRVFQQTLLPLFKQLHLKTRAFWDPQESHGRTFIYLLGFQAAAAREKAWADFASSPEWKKTVADL